MTGLEPLYTADEMKAALYAVPHGDGEHAVEALHRRFDAPRLERREHDLRVGMSAVLARRQRAAQLLEVVDLAVERDDETLRLHRLMSGRREVDDGEPAEPEGEAGLRIEVFAGIVGTAMADRIAHAAQNFC